jgi:hypothetical protein
MSIGASRSAGREATSWCRDEAHAACEEAEAAVGLPGAVVCRPGAALRYVIRDREFTNLTYEIDNLDELVEFVAASIGCPQAEIDSYVHEPLQDGVLLEPLRAALRARPDRNDEPRFGRRLGWYAIVRALQPQLVVETGVHDGLGSALLLRALDLNGSGRLVGFDVDSGSGWLVPERLQSRYELVLGDVRETLPRVLADAHVDFFIHTACTPTSTSASSWRLR